MSKKTIKSQYFRDVNAMFTFDDWMLGKGEGWYGLASAMELAGVKDGGSCRGEIRLMIGQGFMQRRRS